MEHKTEGFILQPSSKFHSEIKSLVERVIEFHKPKDGFELVIIQEELCGEIRSLLFSYGVEKTIEEIKRLHKAKNDGDAQ